MKQHLVGTKKDVILC